MNERAAGVAKLQFELGDRQFNHLLIIRSCRNVAVGAWGGRLLQNEVACDNLSGDIEPAAVDDDLETGIDQLAVKHLAFGGGVDLYRQGLGGDADLAQIDHQSAGEPAVQLAIDYNQGSVSVNYSNKVGGPIADSDFNVGQGDFESSDGIVGKIVVIWVYRSLLEGEIAAESLPGDVECDILAGYSQERTYWQIKHDFLPPDDECFIDRSGCLVYFDTQRSAEGDARDVQRRLSAEGSGDPRSVGIERIAYDNQASQALGDRQDFVGAVANADVDVAGSDPDELTVIP